MGVDAGIASGTRQVLILSVGNVEVRLGIAVLLGETKVNHVDLVATLTNAHEEVVRLDITVDERFGVDVLDAGDELVGKEQDRLQGKLAVAEVEEVLEGRTEQVQNHGIVVALGSEPADKGNADASGKRLVDAGLILQLRMLGLDALQLDGDLFARDDVGALRVVSDRSHGRRQLRTQVNVTETAAANLAADSIFVADTQILELSA